jgi:hypothetical protein
MLLLQARSEPVPAFRRISQLKRTRGFADGREIAASELVERRTTLRMLSQLQFEPSRGHVHRAVERLALLLVSLRVGWRPPALFFDRDTRTLGERAKGFDERVPLHPLEE